MIKTTYTYSFNELSGKPKRYLENQPECKIKGYGVSTDTVTLCVLYEDTNSFNKINKTILDKFKLIPTNIQIV
jgi:hypothetical protein